MTTKANLFSRDSPKKETDKGRIPQPPFPHEGQYVSMSCNGSYHVCVYIILRCTFSNHSERNPSIFFAKNALFHYFKVYFHHPPSQASRVLPTHGGQAKLEVWGADPKGARKNFIINSLRHSVNQLGPSTMKYPGARESHSAAHPIVSYSGSMYRFRRISLLRLTVLLYGILIFFLVMSYFVTFLFSVLFYSFIQGSIQPYFRIRLFIRTSSCQLNL